MIDHQIDDHAHADLLRVIHELDELAKRAVLWVHAVIIGNVVAVVAIRRRIKRLEPHAGDAQAGEIVQPPCQTGEIADTVAVGVDVLFDVEAIDDRVLVPEVINGWRCAPLLIVKFSFHSARSRVRDRAQDSLSGSRGIANASSFREHCL